MLLNPSLGKGEKLWLRLLRLPHCTVLVREAEVQKIIVMYVGVTRQFSIRL